MITQKIVLLDPTSKGKPQEVRRTKYPTNLEGKVLGIIWNGKLGGDILLDRFGELLMERFHLSQILKLDERADTHSGLAETAINELSEKCHCIIIGVGD